MHILQMIVAIRPLGRLIYKTEEAPCSQRPEVFKGQEAEQNGFLFKRSIRFQISSNQICEDCLGEAYNKDHASVIRCGWC